MTVKKIAAVVAATLALTACSSPPPPNADTWPVWVQRAWDMIPPEEKHDTCVIADDGRLYEGLVSKGQTPDDADTYTRYVVTRCVQDGWL